MGNPEILLETKELNENMLPADQEELEHNMCPYCLWPLKVRERDNVKSCPCCGRTFE